jgi:periplasmic protein TonB
MKQIPGKLAGWIAGIIGALLMACWRLIYRLLTMAASSLVRLLPKARQKRLRELGLDIEVYYNSQNRLYRRSVLASVILHCTLLICFASIPSCNRPARWDAASVIPVALVNLPVPKPEIKKTVTQPKRQPTKQKTVTKPRETPKPKPKPPAAEKKKTEAPKIEKKQPPKQQEVAKTPEPQPEPVKQDPPAPTPVADEQKQLTSRVDESTFAYDYYLQIIRGQISQAWQPPAGFTGMGESSGAMLRFRIDRQGRVSGIGVEESSPLRRFDESARMAIMAAQPFPPFPPAYKGQWLTVHLRFALTEWQASQMR